MAEEQKKEESVKEPTADEAKEARKEEREKILAELGVILKEYDNRESDIPFGHRYWDMLNRYRALR